VTKTGVAPGTPSVEDHEKEGDLSIESLALSTALMRADPKLSRFDPLPRIICLDNFAHGYCGWSQLVGNYEDSLDAMHPGYQQHSGPMLSTLAHWDAGSHGAYDSSYALKVATRPTRGAQNVTIKRLTFREPGPIRLEFYFTFKPEATELRLSEADVRSIGFLYDLQVGDSYGADGQRVMPHLRFLNALEGDHVQKWQFKRRTSPFRKLGTGDRTVTHYHLSPDGWEDLEGGSQRLCYNEIPTKVNWHYARFDFDLAAMTALGFRCNDRVFDLAAFEPMRIPAMRNLWCMLNICFFAETDVDKRAMLYLSSVCLSGDF
jgi:hypothetical protein